MKSVIRNLTVNAPSKIYRQNSKYSRLLAIVYKEVITQCVFNFHQFSGTEDVMLSY